MNKKQLCESYIRKYPNTPNLTLAKKLYEENSLLFLSVENARALIRDVKGSFGKHRRKFAVPDLIENRSDKKNPFNLPESFNDNWEPYRINANRALILSDIHIPYHDINSISIALKYGLENDCDAIIINGDLLDFYQISRFNKKPHKPTMRDEFDAARTFFKSLRKHFKNAKIYYKLGNHEERWENYLYVKAPEIFDVTDFRLDILLRLAEYGVEYISDRRIIEIGKLPILHGHEFLGATSQAVNPSRGLYLKTNESCAIGHLHKTSEHNETTLSGKLTTTWSSGCLCYLHPEYARINKWNHGFIFVTVHQGGNYSMQNKRIYNNVIL